MKHLIAGAQLLAPEGFKNLCAGVVYYFLRSSPVTEKTVLVELRQRPEKEAPKRKGKKPRPRKIRPEPLAILHLLERDQFERALGTHIIHSETQHRMPPWLEGLEGKNLEILDSQRCKPKRSHQERINNRMKIIAPLVADAERILDEPDPCAFINQHLRTEHPEVNPVRARLWFLCFLAFGRDPTVLHYATPNIGTWDRMSSGKEVKRGAPSKEGKLSGYNVDKDMKEKILKGYEEHSGLGRGLTDVYIEVMRSSAFGCVSTEYSRGGHTFKKLIQPKGLPFPSLAQFRYHVTEDKGIRGIQRDLHGSIAARSNLDPTIGSFSEGISNFMQMVELDGSPDEALPRGYVEGSTLPPLVPVRGVDLATSAGVGIGFSQGSERGVAYTEAEFCMGVDKVLFCNLYGLKIGPDDWPTIGLPAKTKTDRGPGRSKNVGSRDPDLRPGARAASPSYSPQSNATIESSNPRARHNKQPPSYFQSQFRTIELAREHIRQFVEQNHTRNVFHKVPPDLQSRLSQPTPAALARLLMDLGRSDGRLLPFDTLVRKYLGTRPAKLSRKGITLAGRMYRSYDLKESGACATLTDNQSIDVYVYSLEVATRHTWLDWRGSLIQLDVQYPIPVHNSVLYMSFEEALQLSLDEKLCEAEFRKHRAAVVVETRNEKERDTKKPAKTVRRAGRPKRGTKTAKQEAAEARDVAGGMAKK